MEEDLHLGRYAPAIQPLLPFAPRHRVVDEHDELDVHRLPPADDHLPVNQPVVDAVEHERHGLVPTSAIAARPRSAAWRAASTAGARSLNTKSRSSGKLVPQTTTAS